MYWLSVVIFIESALFRTENPHKLLKEEPLPLFFVDLEP
jgi:hypothetical protein